MLDAQYKQFWEKEWLEKEYLEGSRKVKEEEREKFWEILGERREIFWSDGGYKSNVYSI